MSRNAVMGMVDRLGLMGDRAHRAAQADRGVLLRGAAAGSVAGMESAACGDEAASRSEAVAPDASLVADGLAVRIPSPVVPAEAEAIVVDVGVQPAEVQAPALDRVDMIREAARRWQASSRPSRMPPARREIPPPLEVRVSSGVMAGLVRPNTGAPPCAEAFAALERLTGAPFDERIPGHLPALVAIATVLCGGDPRPMLEPRMPPQTVLRVMRVFAERGMVVTGRPSPSWSGEVDDGAFYEQMVSVTV